MIESIMISFIPFICAIQQGFIKLCSTIIWLEIHLLVDGAWSLGFFVSGSPFEHKSGLLASLSISSASTVWLSLKSKRGINLTRFNNAERQYGL